MIELKDKQQECIKNISGQFLVLAGPGTGKTYTIVHRIKEMIEKGVEPSKILCLTFSNAAVNEMKSRIDGELNTIDSGISIYTYHSFCKNIIEEYHELFELPNDFKMITEMTSRNIIKDCIEEINPEAFRTEKNDTNYYIKPIADRIKEIKQYRLTKEKYFKNLEENPDWILKEKELKQELIKRQQENKATKTFIAKELLPQEKKVAQAYELWKFYELYQEKLNKYHYLDFSDLISLVLDKFELDSSFLEKIANKYDYILVDEYQDTNISQNEIVINLAKSLKSENVFVVGDDNQIIFSFQGARLDTVEKFLEKFNNTNIICLTTNRRSNQNILDFSYQLTKSDSSRLENNEKFKDKIDKKLISHNTDLKNNKIQITKYFDDIQERNAIIDEIEILKNKVSKLNEIAIIATKHDELKVYADLLKNRNIPFELKEGKNIFEIKAVVVLFYYMQLLINPELHSDKILKMLLLEPFKIHPLDFQMIWEQRTRDGSLIENIRNLDFEKLIEPDKIKKFIEVYDYLQEYRTSETLKNIILEIGFKMGILNYYSTLDINKSENILGFKKLIDEAGEFFTKGEAASLEDYVYYLEASISENVIIKTEKPDVELNAVQLLTYHGSKGREFDYVFMPNLISDNWEKKKPNKPLIPLSKEDYKDENKLEEEKNSDRIKTLYVGLTRARHTLKLSFPNKINGAAKSLTCFIEKTLEHLENKDIVEIINLDNPNCDNYVEEINKTLIKRDYDYKKDFNNLIESFLKNKKFSPTSINNYLKCPRMYLYNDILNLSSKSGNMDNFHFGSAVHFALEYAFNYAKENNCYPNSDDVIFQFENKLSKLNISTKQDRKNLIERGKTALKNYYPIFILTPVSRLHKTEETILFKLQDNSMFKGKIDRVELSDNGSFVICDYKTGSAKGKTKICPEGDNEDYYNQIGLYKLFYEKATGKKVETLRFIFPEYPDKNYEFSLDDNECKLIEKKFIDAIEKIKSYQFEPVESKDMQKEPCKYCQFKGYCSLEII